MNNPNQDFADALRAVLNDCGIPNHQIDAAIAGELKEVQVAQTFAAVVAALGTGAMIKAALIQRVTRLGATYDDTTRVWNLVPTRISMGLRLSATEELGAICRYGGHPGFDAAKAITNVLRLIKAAPRF